MIKVAKFIRLIGEDLRNWCNLLDKTSLFFF